MARLNTFEPNTFILLLSLTLPLHRWRSNKKVFRLEIQGSLRHFQVDILIQRLNISTFHHSWHCFIMLQLFHSRVHSMYLQYLKVYKVFQWTCQSLYLVTCVRVQLDEVWPNPSYRNLLRLFCSKSRMYYKKTIGMHFDVMLCHWENKIALQRLLPSARQWILQISSVSYCLHTGNSYWILYGIIVKCEWL